jgi:hypothetical protein
MTGYRSGTFEMQLCTCRPVAPLLLILLAGCAPASRPRVEGTVTLAGKPLGNQTLTLFFEGQGGDNFAQRLRVGADGKFAGEVPEAGKYKVMIEPSLAAQEGNARGEAGGMVVPDQYRDTATSGLEWDVQPGVNKRDFDLR